MKYVLLILALIAIFVGLRVFETRNEEGTNGESTFFGQSLVVAQYGYVRGGDILLYAVVRSFQANATDQQKAHDPRFQDNQSGVFVRDNDGRMIPVGRDGTVYFFDGDKLRTMKVKVGESDIGIGNCRSMEEIWARFQQFELHTNK